MLMGTSTLTETNVTAKSYKWIFFCAIVAHFVHQVGIVYYLVSDLFQALWWPLEGTQGFHAPGVQTWLNKWPEPCCSYRSASVSHFHTLFSNDGALRKRKLLYKTILKCIARPKHKNRSHLVCTCRTLWCTWWFQGRGLHQKQGLPQESDTPFGPGTQTSPSTHKHTFRFKIHTVSY